ncbi:Ig-like domain-containing protein [Clostridium sp. ZBS4]|uniref:Ig-like domain-containing protein n=1 Tax=Clostridium sp. ZBS4 TaxID=2949974 RepID=UPI00207ABD2B|nr:Ig-like domain-containing protein [Clostridium sp. ZBS4]
MKNYFKKIIVIFVMVLTVIGVGAFQNGITANATTVGQQLTQPEKGWKRYDDTNENINYKNFTGRSHDYAYNRTDHYGGKDSSISFVFYGNKIRLIGVSYYHSSNKINIEIDNNNEIFSSYSSSGSPSFQYLIYENNNLSNDYHKVTLTNLASEDSFYFDAIDIDEEGYLLYQNNSISLNKSSLDIKEGTLEKLTATTTPSAVDIDWSSSDESVATVDSNGNIKAIKEGLATITAKIKGTDIKSTCIVTVTKKDVPVEPEQPTNPEQEYIINTAYAKGDNTNNASGQVSIIFKGVAEAQLKVIKTADVDSVYVGDNFTYTIEVTNTSDKIAKSVVIKDNAPNHIQFIPSEVITTQGKVDSSSTSKNIVVNVGDILPSGKVIIKIPVLVVE